MRPLAGGGGKDSFWRIVENLHHAVEHFDVSVRVNVDTGNIGRVEELFQILADEGFAGRLTVYPGQLIDLAENPLAPARTYATRCFTTPEFARATLEFDRLAHGYGLSAPSLPDPTGAPCTAVRANELVVGSEGELWKCFDSVGSSSSTIGNITDYGNPNGRLRRWLTYDPFSDEECRSCIALPVCMGGCAQHAMQLDHRENRCDTFRYNYRERVRDFVDVPVTIAHSRVGASSTSAQRLVS